MEIMIKNYGGIEELTTEIEDGKINFIYGPSGSGKTSLVRGLVDLKPKDNIKIGKEDMEFFTIPDIVDKSKVLIFNEDTIGHFLAEKAENEDYYRILFSKGERIEDLRNEVKSALRPINEKEDEIRKFINDADDIIKSITGRKKISNDHFTANSPISKLENEISTDNYKENCKIIKKYGEDYLNWIEQGVELKKELYLDGKCPLCQRKLTAYRKNQIAAIMSINLDNYKLLYEHEEKFAQFGIELPKYSKISELDKLKNSLIKLNQVKNELTDISENICINDYGNLHLSNFQKIKCSPDFKRMLPDVYDIITKLNADIIKIRIKVGRLCNETFKLIKGNLKQLNDSLVELSIPYRFDFPEYNSISKTANVVLTHIEDKDNKDRRNYLSHGEKNILALLLFIYSSKEDIVIIDDPASSTDENKRKVILNIIEKTQKNETYIILSHDQVFIKYAVLSKYDSRHPNNQIGLIGCMENINSKCTIKNIRKDSFDKLEEQIIKHIKKEENMPYYRLIINMRLLAEIKCRYNQKIYGYLSAILHEETKDGIYSALEKSEIFGEASVEEKESEILNLISDKCFNISLPPVPEDFKDGFNFSDLTDFEKAIWIREQKRKERGKKRKSEFEKELDDIVHLNNSYCISLDPYKYNTFSPHINNEIKKYEGGE